MKLRLLWVGKTREEWLKEGMADYAGRLRRYFPLEVVEVKEEKGGDPELMRRREGERISKALLPGATVILLDERGEEMSSSELALMLGRQRDGGTAEIAFVIGGAYGLSEELRRRGRLLSLSRMTFTHQMVRLFLLEQLYRSCTILAGEPYHH